MPSVVLVKKKDKAMIEIIIWLMIQIITESLPVSSSGHVALYERLYSFITGNTIDAVLICSHRTLNAAAHIPALVIIACYYYQRWLPLLVTPIRYRRPLISIIYYALVSSGITALVYFTIKPQSWWYVPLATGMMITALAIGSLSFAPVRRERMTLAKAALLGIAQSIALLPGISRLGICYVVARWLGIPINKALAYTALIQVPLLCGALLLELVSGSFNLCLAQLLNWPLLAGMLTSSVISWYAFCWARGLAYQQRWWLFVPYLCAIAIVMQMIGI